MPRHTKTARLNSGWVGALLALMLSSAACNLPGLAAFSPAVEPTRTPIPVGDGPTPIVETPTSAPEAVAAEGWQPVGQGLETRDVLIPVSGLDQSVVGHAVRIDPARWDVRVHYTPSSPRTVGDWHRDLGATLTINAGFFLPDRTSLGLIAAEEGRFGQSFARTGYAGMMTIRDDTLNIRSLGQYPYTDSEPLDYAVQGRPMLLYPGRFPVEFTLSPELSRRTAIGQDSLGRLIIVVHEGGFVSLYDLRDWMATTNEADFFVAVNLDGGGSTGLYLESDTAIRINSWTDVPSVIAVYPRP